MHILRVLIVSISLAMSMSVNAQDATDEDQSEDRNWYFGVGFALGSGHQETVVWDSPESYSYHVEDGPRESYGAARLLFGRQWRYFLVQIEVCTDFRNGSTFDQERYPFFGLGFGWRWQVNSFLQPRCVVEFGLKDNFGIRLGNVSDINSRWSISYGYVGHSVDAALGPSDAWRSDGMYIDCLHRF